MHNLVMQEMSPEFLKCWQAAGVHLDKQVQGGIKTWLRAHPRPPTLEHLSFRLGNQLFFVRVEDAEGRVEGPGSLRGLFLAAEGYGGHACVMPMKRKFSGEEWVTESAGWGLLDANSRKPVNPIELVTDKKIEMTRWELHSFAVQVVRDQLEKDGFQLMSWQENPDVDPSIWFVGDSKKPEWVVVRAVRYPEKEAVRPANWPAIAEDCARISNTGHFASASFASVEDPFDPAGANAVSLFRGHGFYVNYEGLDRVR